MIRTAVIGLGKMGISHLAILRTHPHTRVVAACDGLSYLTSTLERYSGLKCYNDVDDMLENEELDAVLIATPSRLHAGMVEKALQAGLDVFCEKPFVLDVTDGERLAALAESGGRVTQVGYHYRFVDTFNEAARLVHTGAIGRVHHIRAEAYGPVVLRPKGLTWRSNSKEGGGVVYDYACHAIDLVHHMIGPLADVSGVVRNRIFSRDVDDEVYCTFHGRDGISGQLCVNWSDESCRKMTTRISIWGENGNIKADRQEALVYLREASPKAPDLRKGWTTINATESGAPDWFYLRGEEYSRQIDGFLQRVRLRQINGVNDFRSALDTDRVVAMIHDDSRHRSASPGPARKRGLFSRLAARSTRKAS